MHPISSFKLSLNMGWNDKSWGVISQSLPVKKPVERVKEAVKVEIPKPEVKSEDDEK